MWLLTACAHTAPVVWERGDAPPKKEFSLAVAPVVWVADVPAPPLPPVVMPSEIESQLDPSTLPDPTVLDPERDAAFLRNEYVGNVRFGGGFVRTGTVQLEVRARLIELNDQAHSRELARRWLTDTVDQLVAERRLDVRPAPAPPDLPPIERVAMRGLHPDDGHDNLNAPRTGLDPQDGRGPLEAGGADYVLLPFVRSYYTHNAGWFLGQDYGCMAGARVEALLVLYEAATGRVVWSLGALGRHIQPREGQPSRAEADQYLLWAEEDVEEALSRHFLR